MSWFFKKNTQSFLRARFFTLEHAKKCLEIKFKGCTTGGVWVAILPATSRHISHTLWLLPSGPDQIHALLLREDQ